MRLADRHGKPLSQVASEYPAWEIPYWSTWLAHTPTGEQRIEFQLAAFRSEWLSAHSKKGAKVPTPDKLLLPDFWDEQDRRAHLRKTKSDVSTIAGVFKQAGLSVIEAKPNEDYL